MPDANELKVFELQSDMQGNWVLDIPDYIPPGPHVVTVQDEDGNEHQVMMYIMQETGRGEGIAGAEPEIVERQVTELPVSIVVSLGFLFLIIVALGITLFRLAHRVDLAEAEIKHRRYTRRAIIFSSIAAIIITAAGLFINQRMKLTDYVAPNKEILFETARVSGKVINPLTQQGVSDVDLVSGNTLVRTSKSGYFIFGSVKTTYGIRLTHPALFRALVFLPSTETEEQQMDIFFEPQMYNLLIRAIDSECRGKFNEVYEVLDPRVKEKASLTDFVNNAKTIYLPKNSTDQEIFIQGTKTIDSWQSEKYDLIFEKVIEIEVAANFQNDYYYLYPSNQGWKLIK